MSGNIGVVLAGAALAAVLLLSGGAKASAPGKAPQANKPKPPAKPAQKPTSPGTKPASPGNASAKPRPRPTQGDDLQALVDAVDSGAKPGPTVSAPAAVLVKPSTVRPAGPVVDVVVPVAQRPSASGVNAEKARKLAPPLGKHIRAKKYDYSRQAVKEFQGAAGLTADGIYGPRTASALAYWGGNAPKPLFKGAAGEPTVYSAPN